MVGGRLRSNASGVAVLLGNAILQIARRLKMVGWRLRSIASGVAVCLGNAIADG